MKHIILSLLAVLLFTTASYGADKTIIGINYGLKTVDDALFELAGLESQDGFSIELAHQFNDSPVHSVISIGSYTSDTQDGSTTIEETTLEVRGGIRKYFDVAKEYSPYIGGGLVTITWIEKVTGYSDYDDSAIGFYFEGGINYSVTEKLGVNASYSISSASVDVSGYDFEIGGSVFSFGATYSIK